MLLAIGDVVRVRSDKTLGTVDGIATHARDNLISLQLSGATQRLTAPSNVELVARATRPMTTARSITTLVLLALGMVAAVMAGLSVERIGGGIPLMLLVTFGTVTAVNSALNFLMRPRRIRV